MHLLYLDHSGEPTDPRQFHFVVAGLCCFERQTHWLRRELDLNAARFDPDNPSAVELHANPMISGNSGWKLHPVPLRRQAVKDALAVIRDSHASNTLFGICKDKRAATSNDLVAEAFEELCSRFDRFLIQAADLVAWAIRRKFEMGKSEFFDIIEPKFHRDANGLRGFAYFPLEPLKPETP